MIGKYQPVLRMNLSGKSVKKLQDKTSIDNPGKES